MTSGVEGNNSAGDVGPLHAHRGLFGHFGLGRSSSGRHARLHLDHRASWGFHSCAGKRPARLAQRLRETAG
jgi:hypothetical protein